MSAVHVWSPGQRALLRFLEREGLLGAVPDPPAGEGTPHDDALFALIAESVPPPVMAEMLALRLRLPLLQADERLEEGAAALLTAQVATRCGAIPIGLQGEQLEVAVANPLDLETVKMIEFATNRRVRVRVATPETVQSQLARLYASAVDVPETAPAVAAEAPVDMVDEAAADVADDVEGAPVLARDDVPAPAGDVEASSEPPIAAPDPIPDRASPAEPEPRRERIVLVVRDASERDRLACSLRDHVPAWIVMTAAEPDEAAAIAALTAPDVTVIDVSTDPTPLATGSLARVPRLVVAEGTDAGDLVVRARTVIDTARRG